MKALFATSLGDSLSRLVKTSGRNPLLLASDSFLWTQVQKLLKQRYSPEQIAGILPRMYPDELSMRVSHETIYTALYAMPRGELRRFNCMAE
jgi:IS30 family transposase